MRLAIVVVALLSGCATGPQLPEVATTPDPTDACVDALADDPRFAPVRSKVELGRVDRSDFALFSINERVAPGERPVIAAWVKARHQCYEAGEPWRSRHLFPELANMLARYQGHFISMAAQLHSGEITYGDFAKKRLDLGMAVEREWQATIDRLEAQWTAQSHAQAQRERDAWLIIGERLRNRPAPIRPDLSRTWNPTPNTQTTTCYPWGSTMVRCETR